jgi:predicted RNA-binding Zn ribbon-like protein
MYRVGFFSNEMLIRRHSGCSLGRLRYRFFAGDKPESSTVLSPWTCRDDFLREGTGLRKCNAGLTAKRVGRGKAGGLVGVRPPDSPTHSWALGPHGAAGSFTLSKTQKPENSPLSAIEAALQEECSGLRALLRDALQMDYADWKQLASKHPAEWVRELLAPLPLTVEAREGAPMARVVCQSLLDVLIVTTQIDGISGLRQRVCKADGCGELFPVRNYEHKIYCNYECAHRQAVRDSRRRAAIEKAKKKSKRAGAKGRHSK